MIISIEYDSCWQNSVLNNSTTSAKSTTRKFNKSKPGGNYQPITKNTVMGVLYRLIGDQRTLYQREKRDSRYFSDIENKINFSLKNSFNYEELAMIINKSAYRTSTGNYIGVVKDDTKLFFSTVAPKLWSVLYLSVDEVIEFINKPSLRNSTGSSMPRDILNRIADIQQLDALNTVEKLVNQKQYAIDKQRETLEKLELEIKNKDDDKKKKRILKIKKLLIKIANEIVEINSDVKVIKQSKIIESVLSSLKNHFSEIPTADYLKKGGEILPKRLYAAALYLQADLLEKSGEDMSQVYTLQTKRKNKGIKTIHGFSKKGFNGVRDFLNKLSTGGEKKTVKTPFTLTKSSGLLNITLDISKYRAKKIQGMINDAGVSSFYLGKKGLAFIDRINI